MHPPDPWCGAGGVGADVTERGSSIMLRAAPYMYTKDVLGVRGMVCTLCGTYSQVRACSTALTLHADCVRCTREPRQ